MHRLAERQSDFRVAALAVAGTLLVLLGCVGLWLFYADWRLGEVQLFNEGAPVTVQVLPETGELPLAEPFDVVTRATLTLPAGDYRLRVNALGRLGRTYRLAVNRAETLEHALSLDEGRLLGGQIVYEAHPGQPRPKATPIPVVPTIVALELTPGKQNLVEWRKETVIRSDGVTGRVVWDASQPRKPYEHSRDPSAWIKVISGQDRNQAAVVEAAPDLDGDGAGDIVWALANTSSIIAMSGKDGSLLWTYTGELDGPGGPRSAPDLRPGPGNIYPPAEPGKRWEHVVEAPVLYDCDRDGISDVVSVMVFSETREEKAERIREESPGGDPRTEPNRSRRFVVAVSGRSGARSGVTRSTASLRAIRTPPGNARLRSQRGARPRWWQSSTTLDGLGSTRRPGDRVQARSSWVLCPRARCNTPTSMATASRKSWLWARAPGPRNRRWSRFPPLWAGNSGRSRSARFTTWGAVTARSRLTFLRPIVPCWSISTATAAWRLWCPTPAHWRRAMITAA